MSLRKEFVVFATQEDANLREPCRRFGITPVTAYKWRHRFQQEGEAGLEERSRRPRHSPAAPSVAVEAQILEAARRYPVWGARKLKHVLEAQGQPLPVASTVHAVLQRHGLHLPQQKRAESMRRFEHDAPNQLWQMNFKGHFETGVGRSRPLTLLDDPSRFLLGLQHCVNERRETVPTQLIHVFESYGLPERITMDNGSPGETVRVPLRLWNGG